VNELQRNHQQSSEGGRAFDESFVARSPSSQLDTGTCSPHYQEPQDTHESVSTISTEAEKNEARFPVEPTRTLYPKADERDSDKKSLM